MTESKPDRFAEKAEQLQNELGIIRGEDSDCDESDRAILVEALREAAAEALQEASEDLEPVDKNIAICGCWKYLKDQAAALRAGK